MKQIRYLRDNVLLTIGSEPFASGGEGNLYRVLHPAAYRHLVAKLYHPEKRTPDRRRKVEFLVNNPPASMQSVVWLQGIVLEQEQFAGFLMPFAAGKKLEILCTPKIRPDYKAEWGRFDLSNPDALMLRLKICFNIAAAVYQVHQTQRYVLVDLKTDNILIQPNGLISIVDMDSVEIIEGERVLFSATVATPEFAPPEYYRNVQLGKTPIFETWDRFSLAVIFYKLLFGIHPYAASCLPPYDHLTSLHQKIEEGFFVHTSSKFRYFQVIPQPHRRFAELDFNIQNLFLRSFEEGHFAPSARPTADEWCWAIAPTSKAGIERELPSKAVQLQEITYTKPFALTSSLSQLPAIAPPQLPAIEPLRWSPDLKIPRLTSWFFLLMMVGMIATGGLFSGLGAFKVFALVLANWGILYGQYSALPEVKKKKQVKKITQTLRRQRQIKGRLVEQMKQTIVQLPAQTQQHLHQFDQFQQRNLIKEKKEIEEEIKALRASLKKNDAEANQLIVDENVEVEALQTQYFGDLYHQYRHLTRLPIEEQILQLEKEMSRSNLLLEQRKQQEEASWDSRAKQEQEAMKVALKQKLEAEKRRLEDELTETEARHQKEKDRLKRSYQVALSNFLRKYLIRANAKDIFGNHTEIYPLLCDQLERAGVRTAADFVETGKNGTIQKNVTLQVVQIPFLNEERAAALMTWRSNLVKNFEFKESFSDESQKIAALKNKIFNLSQDFYKATSALPTISDIKAKFLLASEQEALVWQAETLKNQQNIQKMIAQLKKYQKEFEAKKQVIKEKFDPLHQAIQTKNEALIAQTNRKIKAINQQIFQENEEQLKATQNRLGSLSQSVQIETFNRLNEEIATLNQITNDYYLYKQQYEGLNEVSFETFLRNSSPMRTKF